MPKSLSSSSINKSAHQTTPNGNLNDTSPLNPINENVPLAAGSTNRQSLGLGLMNNNNLLTSSANRLNQTTINTSILVNSSNTPVNKLFYSVWSLLIKMQSDPYPDVAELAQKVVNYFLSNLNKFDLIKKTYITKYMQERPQTMQQLQSAISSSSK